MRTERLLWRSAVTLTAAAALAATAATTPIQQILGVGLMLAAFGGIMGLAFRADLPPVKHPILGGAFLFIVPGLLPGLSSLVGPAGTLAVVGLLVVTSPPVASWIVGAMRGRVLPSQTEVAATAPRHEALRRQWEESTRLLDLAPTMRDRMLLVNLREQILDDVAQQADGALPDYVLAPAPGRGGRGRSSRGV